MPIYKYQLENGEKKYMVRINYKSQQTLKRGFRTRKAAESYERAKKDELEFGLGGNNPYLLFKDLVTKFLNDYARLKLKPRTYDDYESVCRIHLLPRFGERKVISITREDIQQFIKAKMDDGLSARTINRIITIMGKIIAEAIGWNYIKINPVRNANKPRQEKREMDYLQPFEIKRLFEACDLDFLPIVATAVLSGIRQGEQLALRWSDFDFARNCIYIRRSISKGYLTDPKSFRSKRTVTMSPMLTGILEKYKVRQGGEPNRLAFPGKEGTYMSPDALLTRFRQTLAVAGLRPVNWHALRHSHAALMIALGENIKFIQHQMGHASIATTLDRYGHLLKQASAGIGDRLDSLVFGDEVFETEESRHPAGLDR